MRGKYYEGELSWAYALGHYMTGREVPELACPANTVLNYNLAVMTSRKINRLVLHQRLSEVKYTNRKDVKCDSWGLGGI